MLVISSSASRSRSDWKASMRRLAQAHVGQHAAELFGHRMAAELFDRLPQGTQERRAGLHQQREQVQQKGHAAFDGLQSLPGLGRQAAGSRKAISGTATIARATPALPNMAANM